MIDYVPVFLLNVNVLVFKKKKIRDDKNPTEKKRTDVPEIIAKQATHFIGINCDV